MTQTSEAMHDSRHELRRTAPFLVTTALALSLSASFAAVASAQSDAPGLQTVGLQTVILAEGQALEGQVIKRTDENIFLDIGFTIVTIPLVKVREVREPEPTGGEAPAADAEPAAAATGERDSIFYTAELEPGPVDQKAREVAESVVHVQTLAGSGSGFVIDDEKGYVVTNYHVIEQERDISIVVYVREATGLRKVKVEDVQLVALNPFFDLALLKLEDPSVVSLQKCFLGYFQRVHAGDPVFAIGSPLGLERTVSDGIVSNPHRALRGQLAIQTTAAINPGNSGGPLFNQRGEVIGVTSSKLLGGESLGFAIPIHYVKDFLRNREAFAFDKDNPNTGVHYFQPPPKPRKGDKVSRRTEGDTDRASRTSPTGTQ